MSKALYVIKYALYISGTILAIIPIIVFGFMAYVDGSGAFVVAVNMGPIGLLLVATMVVGLMLIDIASCISLTSKNKE